MSTSKRSSLMPFRIIIRKFQDLKAGIGSFSKRNFDAKLPYHHRSRLHTVVLDEKYGEEEAFQQSNWANLPPELLTDVIQRIECSESSWPSRKHVVACAGVCCSWRAITKELVQAPESSGKLTFAISLKQPGPRDDTLQCFIKRDRMTSTYKLYLGPSPYMDENGKFLLSARKFMHASNSDFVISLNAENFSRGSNSYMGRLRSNFLGTKFTVYDSQPPDYGAMALTLPTERTAKQVLCKVSDGNYIISHIAYELNVLGARGPRRMQCTLLSLATSATEASKSSPAVIKFSSVDDVMAAIPHPKSKSAVADCSTADCELLTTRPSKDKPLVLKNKAPRWHEQLQCWCLNFQGASDCGFCEELSTRCCHRTYSVLKVIMTKCCYSLEKLEKMYLQWIMGTLSLLFRHLQSVLAASIQS